MLSAGTHGTVGWENLWRDPNLSDWPSDFERDQCPGFSKTKCSSGSMVTGRGVNTH